MVEKKIGKNLSGSNNKQSLLVRLQYRQLHEMRREYNRFIFQAPTIVVAIIGGTLAIIVKNGSALTTSILASYAEMLFLLSGFILVIAYWALRSQILLKKAEYTLKIIEKEYGDPKLKMYPYEINQGISWWKKGSSTKFIVFYIFILGIFMLVCSMIGLISKY